MLTEAFRCAEYERNWMIISHFMKLLIPGLVLVEILRCAKFEDNKALLSHFFKIANIQNIDPL